MRKVVLYISMSLDGFIADKNGGVAWLEGENPDSPEDGGYTKFSKTVDTVLMGYTTYHQIVTELSPDEWPYNGLETYVLTHKNCTAKAGIHFINEDLKTIIDKMKEHNGKDIWICGGADIVKQCLQKELIDLFRITVIPCILGNGVKLFSESDKSIKLKLCSANICNGMTELIYEPV